MSMTTYKSCNNLLKYTRGGQLLYWNVELLAVSIQINQARIMLEL